MNSSLERTLLTLTVLQKQAGVDEHDGRRQKADARDQATLADWVQVILCLLRTPSQHAMSRVMKMATGGGKFQHTIHQRCHPGVERWGSIAGQLPISARI